MVNKEKSKHSATDAALGYYHQAIYALLVLLDATDEDRVSIETRDDIEVHGPTPKLMQLKHSMGIPATLTEKNDGFWNTLSIWIPQLSDPSLRFVFVTCADIALESPLSELSRKDQKRRGAQTLLEAEAARVIAAASTTAAAKKTTGVVASATLGKPEPPVLYRHRLPGCKAFMSLSSAQRAELLRRITLVSRSFNAGNLQEQTEQRLNSYPKTIRPLVAARLIEWWDYRVARALVNTAPREISREELLERLGELVVELSDDNLPDDFSLESPPTGVSHVGSLMAEQIRIVNGGESRILRAATARWRARQQRDRWISERIGIAVELRAFDDHLVEVWRDRHGPMQDDCHGKRPDEKAENGKHLLDWSHNEAFHMVQQPRSKWNKAFLTQGSYQQLAEEMKLGWHPDYETILKDGRAKESDDTRPKDVSKAGKTAKVKSTRARPKAKR